LGIKSKKQNIAFVFMKLLFRSIPKPVTTSRMD